MQTVHPSTAFLYRRELPAKLEAEAGYSHTSYWLTIIGKFLKTVDVEAKLAGMDNVNTLARWSHFVDPVTGRKYEVRVTEVLE